MKKILLLSAFIAALSIVSCETEDNTDGGKPTDLSLAGTANCYIVSRPGSYSIPTVKGNSSENVGEVTGAQVLWESFGNAEKPSSGDLVSSAEYADGKIIFSTPDEFHEGNAVIAATDASGKILWSWHIWLVEDKIEEHRFANNAGIMMDRNLGATSCVPGEVESLGLMYQWGRKDPFLAGKQIAFDVELYQEFAESTIEWPEPIMNDNDITIEYSIENPTTFIGVNNAGDWLKSAGENIISDSTRWRVDKTIYDPCPAGWRVPDGGPNGFAGKAGFPGIDDAMVPPESDDANKGIYIGSPWCESKAWFPMTGIINGNFRCLSSVGISSDMHTVTTFKRENPDDGFVFENTNYTLCLYPFGIGQGASIRAHALAVRCVKDI